MSRIYLCLDIREQAVSALLIKSGLKGIEIAGHIHVPIEPSENMTNPWHAAISSIKDHLDTRGAVCLVTFPPALASFRNLKLPFRDRRKIRQVLPFEVEPLLPFPLEEVILDFQVVRETDGSDLIAAAVAKSQLQPIFEALSAFRLNPKLVLPGGFPVALCLASQREEETFFYIDFDPSTITIFAVSAGSVYLVRSVYTGSVSQELKIRSLNTHIRRLLVAFETIYGFEFEPERVFLSGEGLCLETVREAFQPLVDTPVELLAMKDQTRLKFQVPAEAAGVEVPNNPLCLAEVDLRAIASLNFFQQRHALFRYWEAYRSDIIKTLAIGVVVLIIAISGLVVEIRQLKHELEQRDRQITSIFRSTFPEVSRIVDPLQQMKIRVKEAGGKDRFAGMRDNGVLNVEILNDLSRLIRPEADVVITRFVRGEGQVLLSGDTDTYNTVDDIKGALANSRYFKAITISSANMDKAANRVKFKLKLEISAEG